MIHLLDLIQRAGYVTKVVAYGVVSSKYLEMMPSKKLLVANFILNSP